VPETVDPAAAACIVGAGPTGLSLGLALSQHLGSQDQIVVLDAGSSTRGNDDPRALALSYGSRMLLERLGAWPGDAATAIRDIHVSQEDGFGVTRLHADEFQLPALGYVVRYGELLQALRAAAARQPNLRLCYDARLAPERTNEASTDALTVALHDGSRLATRLLAHAEGAQETDDTHSLEYRQTAIVCEATPNEGHRHLAWERFTPDGPLALLPLGDRYAVILSVPAARTDEFLALDDGAFSSELSRRLDGRVRFTQVSQRLAFPLKLRWRTALHSSREVWLGNAAQTLHPVSGQGFNLALRDAWTLAETWGGAHGDAAAESTALRRWARARQLDRLGGAGFTDGVVRLFSNRARTLRVARGIGLVALNLLPAGRAFIARRMIFGARAW
jgi:2-octaprenyl-6-methoxyphenol hydroxylase